MNFGDIFLIIMGVAVAMWLVRSGILWIAQLARDIYEVLTAKRRWDTDDDDKPAFTEEMVEAAAEVIAKSPGIDAPKLPAQCWMGLARAVLEAAEEAR